MSIDLNIKVHYNGNSWRTTVRDPDYPDTDLAGVVHHTEAHRSLHDAINEAKASINRYYREALVD